MISAMRLVPSSLYNNNVGDPTAWPTRRRPAAGHWAEASLLLHFIHCSIYCEIGMHRVNEPAETARG